MNTVIVNETCCTSISIDKHHVSCPILMDISYLPKSNHIFTLGEVMWKSSRPNAGLTREMPALILVRGVGMTTGQVP